jgi:signal recognition particle GTPase
LTFGKERDWMFETLSDRLSGIFDKLTGRGALSEADVDVAMREVRRALLEADVALEVVRTFIDKVKERAVGAEIVKSIKPGQMVVKIVHDVLVETLGSDQSALNLRAAPPVAILMVGLQGSGKTTTTPRSPSACRTAKAQGSDGLSRYKPPRRPGTARHSGHAGEGRHLGNRQG